MSHTIYDEPHDGLIGPGSDVAEDADAQRQIVLIVGRLPVNLVVLSRIAERALMRPVTEAPERAAMLLEKLQPTVVILDCGADLHECDALFGSIAAQKRLTERAPYAILLTPNARTAAEVMERGVVDALVAKPVTPDRLQPMLEQVRDRHTR